ncbi:Putative 115 kDa protein in type-1 retrotransposable element R1DM [Eumeta japonica]|uniref:115 kDa protein in type-1 retrotransposable element R1DM n=1 Tax=Eumeta variegata TaxID=151549 RepID=A0A4C1Y6G3_EUMVA|nr:Putative 115 kDa protein in type-1 retrotransposable element R1DM [Eumeta japonica]
MIPKEDDYTRPKSYRPVGLLSVLLKTMERMLVGRLQWHLMPKLQATQYGFTPQRETKEALYDLITYIYKELNLKKIVLMVSLDIEVWTPYSENSGNSAYVQAIADDVVLVIFGQLVSLIEGEANRALACVHSWGVRNKLRFAPLKNNSMVLIKKLKYDDAVVHINGEQISLVGEIRLLGLTIDRKLIFIPHVTKSCKKAANIYKGLARAAKATWSLSLKVVRIIYITMIESVVLYASCAWTLATGKLGVQKMLDTVQRSVALKELESPVYFGNLPYPAHVLEIGYESVEDLYFQITDRLAVVGPHIYKESRIEGKVGAALTLARRTALTKKTAVNYDRFPLLHAKKVIRAVSLEEWQKRYAEGDTGEITKCFFLEVE